VIADVLVPGTVWALMWALVMVVFWTAVVLVIVSVLRHRGPRTPHSSAVRILEERYASGEISREEFLERRAVLTGADADQIPRS
jgi:putative membrane protein